MNSFLNQELSPEQVSEYLGLFDEFVVAHHYSSKRKDCNQKRTSLNSVKILRICAQINGELTQKQRIIVLLRILEFIRISQSASNQELEFVETVAESFNISFQEYKSILEFSEIIQSKLNFEEPNLLLIDGEKEAKKGLKHIYSDGFEWQIYVLRVPSVNFYFFKYFGTSELSLNSQIVTNDRHHILTQGSSIRSNRISPIYYSDIISKFLSEERDSKIVFSANEIEYKFSEKSYGLHSFSFG